MLAEPSTALPHNGDAGVVYSLSARDEGQAHLRPRVLRRETSQILSYYHSADAGRSFDSDSDLYDAAYHGSSPDALTVDARHSNAESPGSNHSDDPDTESVSDYGSPIRTGSDDWNGDRTNENGQSSAESDLNVQYGIALGSPGGDALPLMLTRNADTDDGAGYGSRITHPFQFSSRHTAPSPQFNLPNAFHLSLPQERREQSSSSVFEPHSHLPASTVDSSRSEPGHGIEPDGVPGRRRKSSSHGASDKRRIAIVQMDSETERDGEQWRREARRGTLLSDGFGRVEGVGPHTAHAQQLALARAQFSVSSSSSSSSSSHPPSAFSVNANNKSAAASALLARRGIVGTFALVAPPDASPSAYTNLGFFTPPPLSAPASAHSKPPLTRHESTASSTSENSNNTTLSSSSTSRRQHLRSQSEAVLTNAHGAIRYSNPKSDAKLPDSSSKGERRRPSHHPRKRSRDIGIVGTSTATSPTSATMPTTDVQPRREETKDRTATSSDPDPPNGAQLSPIFQTPSRSQTSLVSSDCASSSSTGTGELRAQSSSSHKDPNRRSQQPMPNGNSIGASTSNGTSRSSRDENTRPPAAAYADPHYMWHTPTPSTAPISSSVYAPYAASNGAISPSFYVMATSSSTLASAPPTILSMPSPAPSPYLYYQPGLHATAGPLPSPPRQIIPPARDSPPPPRPPRLNAPSSGSSSLAKRRSDTSITSKPEQEQAASPIVKQAEIVSPAMTPSTTSSTLVNSQSDDSVKSKGHTREGAFPMTSVILPPDDTQTHLAVKQDQQEQQTLKRKNTMDELVKDVTAAIDEAAGVVAPKTSITSPPVETSSLTQKAEAPKEQNLEERRSAMDLRREESRSTFKGGEPQSPASPSSNYSDDDYDNLGDITITKPLPDPLATSAQPLPRTESQESGSSSSKPQKILDFALKRFSALPLSPPGLSAMRSSPRSSNSHEHNSPERSESNHAVEEGQRNERSPPRANVVYAAKIRSLAPDAMQFRDVLARRSPLERSLGYARKINELANLDPGLGDWVVATKHNLTVPGKASTRKSLSPGAVQSPSERTFTFQPRHPSRGSIASEMTFPKRVDAYVATDLLPQKSEDETLPKGPPPALPYPTLANGPPPHQPPTRLGGSTSTRSNASSHGSGKSTGGGGGFFASIGRKASVRKDRPLIQGAAASQPNKLLSKRQQTNPAPAPRPVQVSAAPSLPGGPRAPPGRVQRAQSVIAPKLPTHAETDTESGRRRSGRAIKRSPSVAPAHARDGSDPGMVSLPDLDAKVGKLADLLPHADRKILAVYLRRAGGMDMVAIGRYLDDEKNGVLIRE